MFPTYNPCEQWAHINKEATLNEPCSTFGIKFKANLSSTLRTVMIIIALRWFCFRYIHAQKIHKLPSANLGSTEFVRRMCVWTRGVHVLICLYCVHLEAKYDIVRVEMDSLQDAAGNLFFTHQSLSFCIYFVEAKWASRLVRFYFSLVIYG